MDIDLEETIEFINNTSNETSIYVGCDSKDFIKNGQLYVAYVGVVVVHMDSKNGAKIFKFMDVQAHYGHLRQRLLNEVFMAGTIAYNLIDHIGKRNFEVHLDLNPNPKHKSSIVVKEATGYVLGICGFKPKLKPESFASSVAADKYVVRYVNRAKRASDEYFETMV